GTSGVDIGDNLHKPIGRRSGIDAGNGWFAERPGRCRVEWRRAAGRRGRASAGGSVERKRAAGPGRSGRPCYRGDVMRVLSPLLLIAVVLGSDVALAQKEIIFGTSKPPVFRAESLDQRFRRTRLSTALRSGQVGPECVQVVGGLLAAVAETGMQFHKRDENLFLHQSLSHAIDTQLSSPTFNGRAYYLALVREVLISGRLPASWLSVAQAIAPAYPALDLGKLSFLSKGIQPIDSFHFTLGRLRQQ